MTTTRLFISIIQEWLYFRNCTYVTFLLNGLRSASGLSALAHTYTVWEDEVWSVSQSQISYEGLKNQCNFNEGIRVTWTYRNY